jgi:hypothetical protein
MPSVENDVEQVAELLLTAAGLPPAQVRLAPPSSNVTVPVAPEVTVAVRVTELVGAEVKAVDGFGLRVVVLGLFATALYVMVMDQEEKVMLAPPWIPSSARYRFQVPFTGSPSKTEVRVPKAGVPPVVPSGAADAPIANP